MKALKTAETTQKYCGPEGSDIYDLWVHVTRQSQDLRLGADLFTTYWEPSELDREKLLEGDGVVRLSIQGMQPPVALDVVELVDVDVDRDAPPADQSIGYRLYSFEERGGIMSFYLYTERVFDDYEVVKQEAIAAVEKNREKCRMFSVLLCHEDMPVLMFLPGLEGVVKELKFESEVLKHHERKLKEE